MIKSDSKDEQIKKESGYYYECPYCKEKYPESSFEGRIELFKTKEGAVEYLNYHLLNCSDNPKSLKCGTCQEFIKGKRFYSSYSLAKYFINNNNEREYSHERLCAKTNTLVYGSNSCREHSNKR